MIDLSHLAGELVTYLMPFLPYLQKAGEKAAEEAAKKLGEGAWEQAKALWGKLHPRVAENAGAQGAVESLVKRPADPRAKGAVELQVEEILAADPGLASELAKLLEAAGSRATWVVRDGAIAQGTGAVAAGKNGIAAGRDVVIGQPGSGMPGGPRNHD